MGGDGFNEFVETLKGRGTVYTVWSGSVNEPISIQPDWPRHIVRGLFSFRTGGTSEVPYDGMNVGLHVGDEPQTVIENRQLCALTIGAPLESWVVAEQIHSANVTCVGRSEAGSGARDSATSVSGTDALVTNESNVALTVMAADCVPLLFFDGTKRVIGAAHSGWKGTVGHIAANVIHTMSTNYGTNPEDVHVWIGPSIRQCCYEVDARVAHPVQQEFGRRVLLPRLQQNAKYLLSLQACVKQDLVASGVPAAQIVDTGVCTSCQADVLFSHRADQGRTGRQLATVYLVS